MRAARLHGYTDDMTQGLAIDDVDRPQITTSDGVVVAADVVVSVAEIPLVGIQLRLALAGMTELTEHECFAEWDDTIRGREDADAI
jgi:hypothetical protein